MKVAIYCRLSEEDRNKQSKEDDSESIQNQKSMLIQYAMERQWEIYNMYSDDDYAGADRNRPEFNRLIADAQMRKFHIILCKTQSRFTRELELVEKYIHSLFPLWGIRFIGVVDNADTEIKGNKKSRQINGLINEWYLEDMSENIKSVLTSRRRQGFHIGSFSLYGYIKDPDKKGHLIIDEEAAEVVREVFALYAQGYGKTAIARMLNDRGVPNPTGYKMQKGLPHRSSDVHKGTLWRYYAISDMLKNQMYIGNMVQGKYASISYKSKINKPVHRRRWIIVEGTHEPIIDRELWDDVQKKINENYKPFSTGRIGIFAKKVKCMHCGYYMRSMISRGERYLKCSTRNAMKEGCIGSFVGVRTLSQVVIDELNKVLTESLDKNEFAKGVSLENNFMKQLEKLKSEMAVYGKKVDENARAIKELYFDKLKGVITESDFMKFSEEFQADKGRFEKLMRETKAQIETVENKIESTDDRRRIIEQYMNITELDRETIEKLIDCILIGKRDTKTKELPVEIHWNF